MRSNILMNALSVSMEGIDPTENIEINPVSEETTVAVDEALDEMNSAEEVVEEHDDAVEELESAADSMESLVVALESAVKAGGMSPRTADMHNRAMAIAVRRLPIDAEHFTVSTESFGGTGDKMTASMEALDGAKELLSKIWTAIKNAVVKAWQAVVNFVTTLGKSARALKKASEVLRIQARDINGEAKTKEIDAKAIAKALHVDGKFTTASSALKTINQKGRDVVAFTVQSTGALKEAAAAVATSAESIEVAVDFSKLPTEQLPGGYIVKIGEGEGKMPKFVLDKNFDEDVKVPTPNRAEVIAISDAIGEIAALVENFDGKFFKNAKKEIDQAISKVDREVKKLEADKEDKKEARSNLRQFRKAANMPRSVGPEYMAYAARSAKAAFNFGKKVVAAYKK